MNSFSEEIMALRHQRRPLRIFHSETSAINKPFHMTDQSDLFESLYFEGFPLGFATEKIIRKQDHSNWDAILVYKTEFVTDAEFDALQSYLDNGGTVLLDGDESLTKNEYGQPRNVTLVAGKGRLRKLKDGSSLQQIDEAALGLVAASMPEMVLTENNGTDFKGCTWRVVKKSRGGFLMNVLNLGKTDAILKVATKEGAAATATDLMTGQKLGSQFALKSTGILLLEIN